MLPAGSAKRRQAISRLLEKVRFLPLDRDYEAYLRPWRQPEDNQKGYYWHCLHYLSDSLRDDIEMGGWTAEDFHAYAKQERGVKTTKDFSVDEWTDHITWLQQTAAMQWGCALPDPE